MSIIGTNSANNLTSQLIPGLQGVKTADGTVLSGNFLNIISMLSESSEFNLTTKNNPELLLDASNVDNNFSTLQLLQKFLDEHGLNTKEKMQPELASKFFELLKSADKPIEDIETAIVNELNPQNLPIEKVLIGAALENIKKTLFKMVRLKWLAICQELGLMILARHQIFV